MEEKVKIETENVEEAPKMDKTTHEKLIAEVASKIDIEFNYDILVKPLAPVKVKKEIAEQIPTGKTDKDGFAKHKVKTEIKEIESVWREGIILAMPTSYEQKFNFGIGDRIVFPFKASVEFDLFMDSVLIRPNSVLGKVKQPWEK